MRISRTVVMAVIGFVLVAASGANAEPALSFKIDPVLAMAPSQPQPSQRSRSRGPAVVRGALIGAGAALVITGFAAGKYGENEGGRFCLPCLVQWSSFTVPIGAGIGAGVGFAVASARSSMGGAPMFSYLVGFGTTESIARR